MNAIKKAAVSTKNTIVRHRGKIAIVTTATTVALAAMLVRNANETNTFLEEHGLLEEFYADPSSEITE